jgi:arsenate reductase
VNRPYDYVIIVCDSAKERCPPFPGPTIRIHWSFDDPSQATGSEEERLASFRRIRDAIETRLKEWLTTTSLVLGGTERAT